MTQKTKFSIYAGDHVQLVLEGHDNRSGRLNDVAELFALVVERDCPELSEPQWFAVCDALSPDTHPASMARIGWAWVRLAARLDGLGDKWGIDAFSLADQLRNSTAGQMVAVAEIVDRYRRHIKMPGMTASEALRLAGARIAESTGAATSTPQQSGN